MPSLLRVLLVEDFEDDATLVVRELERAGYQVKSHRVQTADTMRAALAADPWDIVLSDYSMTAFSGTAALEVLQTTGIDLPFIIVSGTIGEDTAVTALKAGAHDFLVKGRLARLIPAIERALRDVDQRRAHRDSQEALRVSEARFRSLVEHAVFGIYQASLDGQFLAVNPALVSILGYDSAEELLHAGIAQVYVDPAAPDDLVRRCLDHGTLTGVEAMWKRKDGAEIRVRLSGRILEERLTGKPSFEVIVEDVTEQHQLQEQLRGAQRMEAIGQLAGGVAHDFNNMLTAILGYSELLTEQIGPDKPIGQDLLQIKAAAERAAALTRHLLAFSRKQVLAMAPVDLSEVVRTLVPVLRRLLGEHITIVTELAESLDSVMADATQLEHVVVNLCVNARDAMPEGGMLRIATRNVQLDERDSPVHRGATPGAYAAVIVTDTGVGMAAEIQAHIFEPFFTTKEIGRGTGLGLAAVFGTVEQLGGYIEVASAVGRGTTFTIYLPRTVQPSVVRPRAVVSGSPVGTETILLVEDEQGVRAFAKVVLQRFGYTVLEADSAEAAVAILKQRANLIHLLLTDVVLPGMNGQQLAVYAIQERPHMRLLYMSGYADRLTGMKGVLAPDVQLLAKPFTAQALLTKTREILGPAPVTAA